MRNTPSFQGMTLKGFTPPLQLSHFKLIAFDMDSTLINIECVDEIADAAGRKAEVAAITEAAMRGEITDYKDSLRKRVALLKGVTVAHMEEVLNNRLQLNPGAEKLVKACQAAGMKVLLVSGGFTFFTSRVAKAAGFAGDRANRLIEADGCLTGEVAEPILGKEAKLAALREESAALGLGLEAAIAIGDGDFGSGPGKRPASERIRCGLHQQAVRVIGSKGRESSVVGLNVRPDD